MGMVSLVGAGPGDPELITVKGWKRIGSCDALLYDYLAPQALVSAVRKDCALICVGKRAGGMSASQEEINRLLVSCAGKYERVVRLKGGDPFVFGRGGEEALALQEAGVPYEVIPGVTSAIAAPEAAGLPVTHRGVSRSFHVVTGQTRAGEEDSFLQDSLRTLAGTEGTLLFLMSVGKIGEICTGLMENGRSPDTPAAVIENGTLPGQRRIDGTLGTIAGIAERERVVSPAVLVIGETAAFHLAGERNGQESVPADGEAMSAVAVAEVCSENGAVCAVPDETGLPAEGSMGLSAPDGAACTVSDDAELLAAGSAGQISRIGAVGTRETLARFAAALGAGTEQPAGFVPLLTMEVRETEEYGTLREETARLASYDWIVFLSRQAVNLFFRALSKSGRDARALAPCRVAVNGAGTAAVLAEHGIRADFVSENPESGSFAAQFAAYLGEGKEQSADAKEQTAEAEEQAAEAQGQSAEAQEQSAEAQEQSAEAQEQSADAPAAAHSGRQIQILLPRAVKGDGVFAARMAEAGAVVTEIRIYDVRGGAMDEERRRSVEEGRLDAIVLFSTSGAAALTEALRSAGLPLPRRMRYYCMGERTAAALRERLEEETEGSTAAALQRLLEAAHGGTIPEIIVPPLCTMAGMAAEIRSVQV